MPIVTASWLTAPSAPRSAVGDISEMKTGTEVEAMPTATPQMTRPTSSGANEPESPWSTHDPSHGSALTMIVPLRPIRSHSCPPSRAPIMQPTLTTEP